jgi:MFS family permease
VWLAVLELTENVFEAPFSFLGFWMGDTTVEFDETGEAIGGPGGGFEPDIETDFGGNDLGGDSFSFDAPDPTTIGVLSLAFGVVFVLIGRWLDRNGRHGAATPFAFAAIPCLAAGVISLSDDLEASGSGLLLIVIGLAMAWNGATIWRRATSWIGGAAAALGLAIFLGDMAGDSATTGGMLYVAGGIALVFAGHLIATATDEPDEMTLTTGAVEALTGPKRRVLVAEPAAPPGTEATDDAFRPPAPPPPDDDTGTPPPPE